MSRYVNVRGKHKHRHAPRVADRHAPAAGSHAPADTAPDEREAYAKTFREHAYKFYGIDELEKAIKFFLETLDAHSEELAALRANPKGFEIENYRWKIAPSVAMRAAKALIDALETRRIRRMQVTDVVKEAVAKKFHAPVQPYDAAVTEPADSANSGAATHAAAWGETPANEAPLDLNQLNTLVNDARKELAIPRAG
jgi:hypothetical protein